MSVSTQGFVQEICSRSKHKRESAVCDLTDEIEDDLTEPHTVKEKALPLPRLPPLEFPKREWKYKEYAAHEYMQKGWIGLYKRILENGDVQFGPECTSVSVAYVCEVMFEASNKRVGSNGIATLQHARGWLSDDVVNACMGLMNNRQELPDDNEITPRCIFESSLWYANLFDADGTCNERYAKNINFAQANLLIVPVHSDAHWVLMVADLGAKKITVYNSQTNALTEPQKRLERFFKCIGETGKWTQECITPPDIPEQLDGYNCGLFTIAAADCIARGRWPSGYEAADIRTMRGELLKVLDFPKAHIIVLDEDEQVEAKQSKKAKGRKGAPKKKNR